MWPGRESNPQRPGRYFVSFRKHIASIAAVLLLCGRLAAQPCDTSRFAQVREWSGTFTVTGSGSGTVVSDGIATDYNVQETIVGSPDLTSVSQIGGGVNMNASIQVSAQFVQHIAGGDKTQTLTANGFTVLGGGRAGFSLLLNPGTCKYQFSADVILQGTLTTIQGNNVMTDSIPVEWGPANDPSGNQLVAGLPVANMPIPSQGYVLSGSLPSYSAPPLIPGPNNGIYPETWNVSWTLTGSTVPCNFGIAPTSQNFSNSGGNGSVSVTANSGCQWGAGSTVDWVTITSESPGTGNGVVTYTVAVNTGPPRTAVLNIAGQPFTVSQGSQCDFTINPTSQAFPSAGGTGAVQVTASDASCPWTATSPVSWVTITSGSSGSGNGTVGYSVAANAGATRSATLDIAGQDFTVTQSGPCTYLLSANGATFGPAEGNGSVDVIALTGCGWTAASNASWVTISSGGIGSGNGTVGYAVAANPGTTQRVGTLTIANTTYTVTETGNPLLIITKTHSGNFIQGQQGASYTVTVSNAAGAGPTSGTVTITETTPSGLILVSMNGSGWTCGGPTCTRTDTLAGGSSYPLVTVTVDVDATALSPQVNVVSLAGGGSATLTAMDSTIVDPAPVLSIVKTHSGSFLPGQQNAAYTVTVSNAAGAGATSGTVMVTENIPLGLTLASMAGAGWACPSGGNTCTRSDSLAGGLSYPPITVLMDVKANAGSPQVNGVTVSGGGTATASTTDSTIINGPSAALRFNPVAPCRVMDTRNANGPLGGPFLAGGSTRTIPVPSSTCNIPATAAAYSLNVTVVPRAGTLGYLTVWPTDLSQPLVSTLNSLEGLVLANAVIVPAGTNGSVNAYVTDDSDLVIDINGYFVPPATGTLQFYPLTPCRILDTRNATGTFGGPSITGNTSRSFPIPSSACNVPATAEAYSLNVTVVPQGPLGYLTAWPTGQPQPVVSTLNSLDGTVLANAAIVPAGTNGAVSFFAANTTDLVADINGYFAPPGTGGLNFYAATPCRIVDTRNANGTFGGPIMNGNTTRTFPLSQGPCGLPSTAAAYSLNMTVVPQGPLGYLTTWPTGGNQPLASTLNALGGQIVANAALVPAGTSGAVNVYVTSPTHVIIDTNGYFGQ
jgi:uncharacterized repeat protein (TIGR01451 family)